MADPTTSNRGKHLAEAGKATRFQKGDPRINRKGRPKTFDQLRAAAQEIAHEQLPNGMTVTDAILKIWSRSKDLNAQKAFMEYAFGKVPDKIEGVSIPQTTLVLHYGHERERTNGSRLPTRLPSGAN